MSMQKFAQLDKKIETTYSMCDEKWNAYCNSAKFSHFWLGKSAKMNVRLWDKVESEFAWVNDYLILAKICVACENIRGLNVMQEANHVKGRLAKVYEQNVNMFIIKIWEWWNSVRQIGVKNIVPRSNDSSCVSKECDNFDEDAWHTNYVLWWLIGCKLKMVIFAMARCSDEVSGENFLHHKA